MEAYKINEGVPLYYLTFTVIHWLPVFVTAEPALIFCNSLNYCHQHKCLRINAFVIMPTHIHLIVFDADFDNGRLRQTITAMRQFTGRKLIDFCEAKMPKVYGQLMNAPRRQDRSRQFWQPSKHPVAIQTQAFWQSKLNYLHNNPQRKGLVREAAEWRFSSAGYCLLDLAGGPDVNLSAVRW